MFKRIILAGAAVLMLVALGAIPARAAPATRASHLAPQHVSLLDKTTLRGETSIDGPALASRIDTFENKTEFNTVIAWTGTDGAHKLNLMESASNPEDGPLTFGNKVTLGDTSIARPAVLRMSPASGGVTILAWTGTDKSHTLNVLWNAFDISGTNQVKVTLWGETSIGAPALAFWKDGIALAWTGTDTNHSLNVLPLTTETLKEGTKTVLRQFSSLAGPNLSAFSARETFPAQLVLSWTTKTQHLNQAYSSDGVSFTNALGSGGTPQLSAKAPDSLYGPHQGAPEYWMAWTGTNSAHSLNIQWTTHWPQWPDPTTTKTVLGDTAFGGPQIAFSRDVQAAGHVYLFIAWTGTDGAHTLNVARWQGV